MTSFENPSDVFESVSSYTNYVTPNSEVNEKLTNLTKLLYEYGNNADGKSSKKNKIKIQHRNKKINKNEDILLEKNKELATDGFGNHEIWSQIEQRAQSAIRLIDNRLKEQKHKSKYLSEINQKKDKNLTKKLTSLPADNVTHSKKSDEDAEDLSDYIVDENDLNEDDWNELNKDLNDEDEENENENENEKDDENDVENENDDDENGQGKKKEDPLQYIREERKKKIQKEKTEIEDNIDDLIDESKNPDEWSKQVDELEDFINQQFEKEKDLAKENNIDLNNEDLEEQSYFYDEFQNENDEKNNYLDNDDNEHSDNDDINKNMKNDKREDEFAWLQHNVAKDDDNFDDEKNEDRKESKDNIDDLFNFPSFPKQQSDNDTKDNNSKEQNEDTANDANLSRFEREEKEIRDKIAEMEEENLVERSWEYQGESTNSKQNRPKNSLLQTYLDFDYCDKLKPSITEDLTLQIENLIIDKIKQNKFDDVEKKQDFAKIPTVPKRKLIEIQDTKSSMGLAELYERQYLTQVEQATNNNATQSEDMNAIRQHEKIARMKADLFYSLDQLSHYHYIPRASIVESNINVKTHTKAMFMEEMLPFAQSKGETNLTPQQLYSKPKDKVMVGHSEMTKEEKKKKRRENKKHGQHKKIIKDKINEKRGQYDEKFQQHMSRIQALNEIRQHAMAAIKKDGFSNHEDHTNYTSSKQMFEKIQKNETDNNKKRKLHEVDKNSNNKKNQNQNKNMQSIDKKRKVSQLML